MALADSSSSDDVDELPSVPRVRRNLSSTPASDKKSGRPSAKSKKKDRASETSKRQTRANPRSRRLGKHALESVHSDDDENEDVNSDDVRPGRAKRLPRRTLQARKIVDDEDDDDEQNSTAPVKVARKKPVFAKREEDSDDDDVEEDDDDDDSIKSEPSSPEPVKKKARDNTEVSSDSKDEEEIISSRNQAMKGAIQGRNDLLAQLEDDNEDSDDFNSDDSGDKQVEKKSERLTSRQRALQGESVDLEFTKLESPRGKKQEQVPEEWSHDEEVELKKQQKARLRQMIHEKRNKEKRAAMVDKVLRGVTSKRKKFTMASEARAASIGTRLSQNEAREGCLRFVSNSDGISLSIPIAAEAPLLLHSSAKAAYPPMYKRDPKTGKRILSASASAS